jgi:hypothetical protein
LLRVAAADCAEGWAAAVGDEGSEDDEPSVGGSTRDGRSDIDTDLLLSMSAAAGDAGAAVGGAGSGDVGLSAAMEMARTSGLGADGLCGGLCCGCCAAVVAAGGVDAC